MEPLAFLPIALFALVAVIACAVAIIGGRHADEAARRALPRRHAFRPMVIEGGKSRPLGPAREAKPPPRIAGGGG